MATNAVLAILMQASWCQNALLVKRVGVSHSYLLQGLLKYLSHYIKLYIHCIGLQIAVIFQPIGGAVEVYIFSNIHCIGLISGCKVYRRKGEAFSSIHQRYLYSALAVPLFDKVQIG